MLFKHYKKSDKHFLIVLLLGFTIFFVGLLHIFEINQRNAQLYNPILNLVKQVKLETTQAHLWLEEFSYLDTANNYETVLHHFARAKTHLNELSQKLNRLKKLEIIPQLLTQAKNDLDTLNLMALQRFETSNTLYPINTDDRMYNDIFIDFIEIMDRFENEVHLLINRNDVFYQNIKIALIILIFLGFGWVLIKANRFVVTRNKYLSETKDFNQIILEKNREISLKNDEINSQNEEIKAQNEELEEVNNQILEQNQRLIESEERYKKLFAFANDAILLIKDYVFVDFNNQALKLYGCQLREQLYLKSPIDFSPEYQEDGELSSAKAYKMMRAALNGDNQFFEWTHHKFNGTLLITEISLSTLIIHEREYILAIARDITEKKRYEQKLRVAEERWNFALQGAGDGVWDWNLLTNEVFFSSKWKEIIGYQDFEIGHHFDEWKKRLHPKEKDAVIGVLYEQIAKTQGNYQIEHRLLCKDGTFKWVLSRGKVMERDPIGKATRVLGTHTDICERKKIENELKESEARFQAIFNYMNSGVAIYKAIDNGKDFVFEGFNQAAEKITNIKREEVVGKRLLDKFPNMDKAPLFESLKKVYKTKQPIDIAPFYYEDAHRKGWRKNFIYALPNGNIVAIFDDITKEKEAELELIESKERYKTIVENSPIGIFHYNQESTILECNDIFVEIMGSSRKALIGFNMLKSITDKNVVKAVDISLKDGFGLYEGLYTSVTAQKTVPLRAIFKGIRDENNSICGGIGIIENISQRLLSQQAINRSKTILKETQNIAKVASIEYIFANHEFNISENFKDVMSFSDEELKDFIENQGRSLMKTIHQADREQLIELNKKAFICFDDFSLSFRRILPNNEIKYIKASVKYYFEAGEEKPNRFLVVFNDYTEQKINEQLKLEIELAEETANIKQQFLASMSHEIRTPMTGIIGMIDFLLNTNLDPQQFDYALTIKKSSENLMNIVNDVLNLSKIEAGKFEIKNSSFNLIKLINDVEQLFRIKANEKMLELEVVYDDTIPEIIIADENRLRQIIANLISNAIKYTIEGKITVKIDFTAISDNELNFRVEVIDTGVGIEKESQDKLFKKFSQVNKNQKISADGIGLGLAICKELVELMEGNIGMESEAGNGSKFWFTFKAKKASIIPETPKIEIPQIINCNLNVILTEDKLVNQKVITLMLQNMGCSVHIANHGEELLSLYQKLLHKNISIDLIFLDIQMPVMDGITALKELRKRYDTLPPIIGLSANAMEGDAERYISQGLDDYLSKPVTKEMIYLKIHKYCKLL